MRRKPPLALASHPIQAALEKALGSGAESLVLCWMLPTGERYCRSTLDVLSTVGLLALSMQDMGEAGDEAGN